jgi:uncharacterized protein YidB (DUF937 family)
MVVGLLGKKGKGKKAASGGGIPGMPDIPGLSALTGGQGGLLKALLPALLGSGALSGLGGLGGILSKLQGGGLGKKADSWVAVGPNEDVDPDALEAALGKDHVAKLASEAGVSHDEAKTGLSALLPKLVDQVTPDGKVPGAGQMGGLLGGLDLGKLLGR